MPVKPGTPPDMRERLPAGHPVWLVIEAVRLLDTPVHGHARSSPALSLRLRRVLCFSLFPRRSSFPCPGAGECLRVGADSEGRRVMAGGAQGTATRRPN